MEGERIVNYKIHPSLLSQSHPQSINDWRGGWGWGLCCLQTIIVWMLRQRLTFLFTSWMCVYDGWTVGWVLMSWVSNRLRDLDNRCIKSSKKRTKKDAREKPDFYSYFSNFVHFSTAFCWLILVSRSLAFSHVILISIQVVKRDRVRLSAVTIVKDKYS